MPEPVIHEYRKVKTILISLPEPEPGKSPFADIVKRYSIKVDFRPFTHVEGLSVKDFRKDKVYANEFTAVIFNSRNAVDNYFRLCDEMRIEIPKKAKYFCVSESIAVYIQKYIQLRKRKVFQGNGNLNDLIPMMTKHKDEKFLMPCSDVSTNATFIKAAEQTDIYIKEAMMFKTVSSDLSDLSDVKYDILVFYNPSAIKSLFENFSDFEQGNTQLAVFGSATKTAAIEAGLIPNITAPEPNIPSMPAAIEDYLKKIKQI